MVITLADLIIWLIIAALVVWLLFSLLPAWWVMSVDLVDIVGFSTCDSHFTPQASCQTNNVSIASMSLYMSNGFLRYIIWR